MPNISMRKRISAVFFILHHVVGGRKENGTHSYAERNHPCIIRHRGFDSAFFSKRRRK